MREKVRIPLDHEFKKAVPVLKEIEQAGYEAYFVGGSVRDAVLGQAINDIDIASSAFPAEIKEIFNKTIDVGIEHGTVLVLFGSDSYEITTFRTEGTYADFRRPDQVQFVRSLEEDLKRRDFTINALALDSRGHLTDLFHGLEDLEQGLIRAVGCAEERFNEDALRMMRAVRFQSQLDFEIDSETFDALVKDAHLLEKIAVERIHIEFIKLMQGQARAKGLMSMVESQMYRYCPSFEDHASDLKKLAQYPVKLPTEASVWAIIAYYFAWEDVQLKSNLKAWKTSNQVIKQALAVYRGLLFRLQDTWTNKQLYDIGIEAAKQAEYLAGGLGLSTDQEALVGRWENLPIYSKQDLAVNGDQILQLCQKKAGPWLGQILNQVEEAVLNEEVANNQNSLLAWVSQQV